MPNAFAFLVLGLWPLVSFGLFKWQPAGRALLGSVFLAYLFLPPPPTGFDFPLVPPLTKETLPSLALIMIGLLMYRDAMKLLPTNPVVRVALFVFIFSPALTALTNTDPMFIGRIGLPGLGIKDAVSLIVQQFLLIVPMLMARSFLTAQSDQRDLLIAFLLFGLLYSIPMLIEVRLSPQLNIWIYGFFQHNFEQMIRYGGFRPIVFLYHGLWVAFFAMSALVASAILVRTSQGRNKAYFILTTLYLFAVLVLCKSAGSLIFAVALIPLVLLLPRALQLRLAMILVALSMAYPTLKTVNLVPEKALLEQAARINEERAASLQFRLENENTLMERALERPVFGWGSWGRNQIIDPRTGEFQAVSDGRWVLVLGMFGWVGFAAEMLLLGMPVFLIWAKTRGRRGIPTTPYLGGLSLLLAVNMVDLLPNATLTPLTWLIAGVLLGYAENAQRVETKARTSLRKDPKMKLRSVM